MHHVLKQKPLLEKYEIILYNRSSRIIYFATVNHFQKRDLRIPT